jgi:anhydro-N-acetylmuramic acid kinase
MTPEFYVGLMSGTSLDGIDAVLACFDRPAPVRATRFEPFPEFLRRELECLLQPGNNEVNRCSEAANELARCYARTVDRLLAGAGLDPSRIRAIGCHGQTIRHCPERGFTVQLGNGSLLAELSGVTVVCDFRSRDIAAGGQGAPLVPAFHSAFFGDPSQSRAILNLGGIANITYLPPNSAVTGFDCGPGNCLLDEWIREQRGLEFDADGSWARQGRVIDPLLNTLLGDHFFLRPVPKSTGRELFNLKWVRPHLRSGYPPCDIQATLAELTARSVTGALLTFCPGTTHVFACGGGAGNSDLLGRIRRLLPKVSVATTSSLGIEPDWVEAAAFAWLARETLSGRTGNLPSVTGAAGARVLGCIYPK